MNRRSFFATLAAPLVARFATNPIYTPVKKIGDTITVKRPAKLRPGDIIKMDVVYLRNPMPLKVYSQSGVDFEFSTADACLNLDELRKRYA